MVLRFSDFSSLSHAVLTRLCSHIHCLTPRFRTWRQFLSNLQRSRPCSPHLLLRPFPVRARRTTVPSKSSNLAMNLETAVSSSTHVLSVRVERPSVKDPAPPDVIDAAPARFRSRGPCVGDSSSPAVIIDEASPRIHQHDTDRLDDVLILTSMKSLLASISLPTLFRPVPRLLSSIARERCIFSSTSPCVIYLMPARRMGSRENAWCTTNYSCTPARCVTRPTRQLLLRRASCTTLMRHTLRPLSPHVSSTPTRTTGSTS